jgi:hypothetical protein
MSPQLELNISNLSFARLVETLRADAKIQKKPLSDIEAEWQQSQESMESSTQ